MMGRFNTQPPEGGCPSCPITRSKICGFNTQPPEGGCLFCQLRFELFHRVSTHSRPKAAAAHVIVTMRSKTFQHTAARRRLLIPSLSPACPIEVSTHSRPKAAAFTNFAKHQRSYRFNTQPPEGGCHYFDDTPRTIRKFQHTAARRRLRYVNILLA